MNVKNISIALTVLVIALLATLLMQKGSYVSQATEHYTKTTTKMWNMTTFHVLIVNAAHHNFTRGRDFFTREHLNEGRLTRTRLTY